MAGLAVVPAGGVRYVPIVKVKESAWPESYHENDKICPYCYVIKSGPSRHILNELWLIYLI